MLLPTTNSNNTTTTHNNNNNNNNNTNNDPGGARYSYAEVVSPLRDESCPFALLKLISIGVDTGAHGHMDTAVPLLCPRESALVVRFSKIQSTPLILSHFEISDYWRWRTGTYSAPPLHYLILAMNDRNSILFSEPHPKPVGLRWSWGLLRLVTAE